MVDLYSLSLHRDFSQQLNDRNDVTSLHWYFRFATVGSGSSAEGVLKTHIV